jgi:hypothetical protein
MNRRSTIRVPVICALLIAACWITGIALIAVGNHRAAQDYYYNVMPWGIWGAFFIALPFIAGAIWVLSRILRLAAADRRRYLAWKGTLPPGQQIALDAAELAALSAAAWGMHEHHRNADERLSASVMGRDPAPGAIYPRGRAPRMSLSSTTGPGPEATARPMFVMPGLNSHQGN